MITTILLWIFLYFCMFMAMWRMLVWIGEKAGEDYMMQNNDLTLAEFNKKALYLSIPWPVTGFLFVLYMAVGLVKGIKD